MDCIVFLTALLVSIAAGRTHGTSVTGTIIHKTISLITHHLNVSFVLASLYCGWIWLIQVNPNPLWREPELKLAHRFSGIIRIVLMSLFSWQGQNLC